jgi:hypothetical protein
MSTFTVTFTTRDEQGRFKRFFRRVPASDYREVESWVRHGERNGRWFIEGPVTIERLNGERRTIRV